jgi:hypothetical protein
MEVLIEEKNTASLLKTKATGEEYKGSSIFSSLWGDFLLLEFGKPQVLEFIKKGMAGTTIFTNNPVVQPVTKDDEYQIGYFNDDYDLVAKAPITKSFKVKVKINSITRLQPKVFIDNDELTQLP